MGIVLPIFFRFNSRVRKSFQDAFNIDLAKCVDCYQEISNKKILGWLRRVPDRLQG